MPSFKLIPLYKLSEMSEALKNKVLKKYHTINVDNDYWYEDIVETWKEKLTLLGFCNIQMSFSGFWSQGDGASFIAELDLAIYLKSLKKGAKYRALLLAAKEGFINILIKRNNYHYVHENSVDVNFDIEEGHITKKALEQVQEFQKSISILAHVRSLSRQFYTDLENEYIYLTSDENIIEALQDDYFNERGCIEDIENYDEISQLTCNQKVFYSPDLNNLMPSI